MGDGRERPSTLIAEDLLLLLLDDDGGRTESSIRSKIDPALARAVLAELSLAGAIDMRKNQVAVVDAGAVSDPLLVYSAERLSSMERPTGAAVRIVQRDLRGRLLDRLEASGMIERRRDLSLGALGRAKWPAVDVSHEAAVRSTIEAALFDRATPDDRTAALVTILTELGQLHRLFRREGFSVHDVKDRGARIAAGGWARWAMKRVRQEATELAVLFVINPPTRGG